MTINEAILILQVRTQSRPLIGNHEVYGAIQLGIEALKRIKDERHLLGSYSKRLLPGETEK